MAKMILTVDKALKRYLESLPPDQRPTDAQIAANAGISLNTLKNYMDGVTQNPNLSVLGKLCEQIGVRDVSEVIALVED